MARSKTPPVLTKQQRRVLNFVSAFTGAEGYAPTLEEIRDHMSVSAVSTVHEHIERLIEKGYLSRGWNQSRSIALTPGAMRQRAMRLVPLEGRVSSGRVERFQDSDEVGVPEALLGKDAAYALRVSDDSLLGEGIRDGDTLVVGKTTQAENGALVVAAVAKGNATVVRYTKRGRKIKLTSDETSVVELANKVRLHGVVVGLLRSYCATGRTGKRR